MAFTAKSLASGTVASSKTTIYTVPSLTKGYVKFLHVHNAGTATETVIVYAKQSAGSSVIIGRVTLLANEQADIIDKDSSLVLSTSDTIEAQSTNNSNVQYFISGGEET